MNRNYDHGTSFQVHICSAARAKIICLYLQNRFRTLSESVRSDDLTPFFEQANRVMRHYNRYDFKAQFISIIWERVGLHSFKEKQSNLTQDGFSKRPMRGNKNKKSLFLD